MKTVIQGQHIKTTFYVDTGLEVDKNGIERYVREPKIKYKNVIEWRDIPDIKEIDGDFIYNIGLLSRLNISEDETIKVLDKIYRLDLGALLVHTDKILSEPEVLVSEEECNVKLKEHLHKYKCQVIESDRKVTNYVKVHKLDLSDIEDIDELIQLVYSDGSRLVSAGKVSTYTELEQCNELHKVIREQHMRLIFNQMV